MNAREHYQAVHDLIGPEDLALIKAFLDATQTFIDHEDLSEDAQQGMGLLVDILEPNGIAEDGSSALDPKANIAVYECEKGQRALVCTIPFEELLENIGLMDDDPELQELKTSLSATGKGRANGCVGTWFEYEVVQ